MRFRKKPVSIEAFRWTGEGDAINGLMQWAMALPNRNSVESIVSTKGPTVLIRTLEGDHTASPGDWIICGVKGELYPCKPDIFALTYEQTYEPVVPIRTVDEEARGLLVAMKVGTPDVVIAARERLAAALEQSWSCMCPMCEHHTSAREVKR